MNEDRLNELLERCESHIERELLQNLYPHLTAERAQELCAQYMIDYYDDMPLTIPDFAFPDMQIANYCDGFDPAQGNREKFARDRSQLNQLQLRGWIVLRFAGSQINSDREMVIETIQRSIAQRTRQQEWRRQQQQERQPQLVLKLHPATTKQERKQVRQLLQGHQRTQKPQSQQKPEGGMCGVIVLACVIVGILVLLDFIF